MLRKLLLKAGGKRGEKCSKVVTVGKKSGKVYIKLETAFYVNYMTQHRNLCAIKSSAHVNI